MSSRYAVSNAPKLIGASNQSPNGFRNPITGNKDVDETIRPFNYPETYGQMSFTLYHQVIVCNILPPFYYTRVTRKNYIPLNQLYEICLDNFTYKNPAEYVESLLRHTPVRVVSLRTQPMFSLQVLGDYWQMIPENDRTADSTIRNILTTFLPEIYHSQESWLEFLSLRTSYVSTTIR